MESELIKKYFNLKDDLNFESFDDSQRTSLNKIFGFVEREWLKIYSGGGIGDDLEREIDTHQLSKRLNEFLIEHNITKELFNREIFKISTSTCLKFIRKPEKWSSYKPKTQKRIKIVEKFLNNKRECEIFKTKYGRTVRDDDEISQSDDEETPMHPIDTFELSRRLKRFLRQNSITIMILKRKIVKIPYSTLHEFLNKPRKFSQYCRNNRKKLLKLHSFLKDEQRVKSFLEDHQPPRGNHDGDSIDQNEGDSEIDGDLESEIDTIGLSKRLNMFLRKHSITRKLFNRQIFGISNTNCWTFFNEPKKWQFYRFATQKRIKMVNEFLNNKEKRDEFVTLNRSESSSISITLDLSKRVNQFLEVNGVSVDSFNSKIVKTSDSALGTFLKRPHLFSSYSEEEEEEVVERIGAFMNDEKAVKEFLDEMNSSKEDQVMSVGHELDDDDEFRVEYIKDEDDDVILLSD